ncbi:hypothetical protein [Streptomyces humi]|nr:hypothetical protein [Streptomyces humi]
MVGDDGVRGREQGTACRDRYGSEAAAPLGVFGPRFYRTPRPA